MVTQAHAGHAKVFLNLWCRDREVTELRGDGLMVDLEPGLQGFVPTSELDITHFPDLDAFHIGDPINVKVLEVGFLQPLSSGTLYAQVSHAECMALTLWVDSR